MKLTNPNCVTVIPSGEMLSSESLSIRKMDNSGFMKVIGGSGSKSPSSDHPIPAKSASIQPRVVAYARDGIVIGDDRGYVFMLSNRTKCYGVWSDNSAVCYGHGSCIGEDRCKCGDGWVGLDCSITHCFGFTSNLPDVVCSGRASVSTRTNVSAKMDTGDTGVRPHRS